MKISLHNILVKELHQNYKDDAEEGVIAYSGQLNVRPPYQREFIYNETQKKAVIQTVKQGLPLNTMYWCLNQDGTYELMDGQQRTISICSYIEGDFSVDHQYFHNLTEAEKAQILNYELMIYVCEGTDKEKLNWFQTINIAGEKLTKQELRNAVYTGPWLASAKEYFSKTNCIAYKKYKDYMRGTPIRQEYLEDVLSWVCHRDSLSAIEDYMSAHQHDKDANDLKMYYTAVMDWVLRVFPVYRKELKGLEWGILYNQYHNKSWNPDDLERRIGNLMKDEDVTAKRGIYKYLLSGDEKHLNLRTFTPQQKSSAYEKQKGICPLCNQHFAIEEMEADHIDPWSQGGHTTQDNCQMLCKKCNRRKSDK